MGIGIQTIQTSILADRTIQAQLPMTPSHRPTVPAALKQQVNPFRPTKLELRRELGVGLTASDIQRPEPPGFWRWLEAGKQRGKLILGFTGR